MSEMAITADRLVVIGRGKLIAEATVADFLGSGTGTFTRVRSREGDELARLLRERGADVEITADGALRITGATGDDVGDLARANGLTLQELSTQQATLEERYMELTSESVDFRTAEGALAATSNRN